MLIVGINAYHGDASAAAVVDGRLEAAAEEERFSRAKHAAGFPTSALRFVGAHATGGAGEIRLAVPRDPWARIWMRMRHAMRVPALAWRRAQVMGRFASVGERAAEALGISRDAFVEETVEHHAAHLASSFFASPFEEAALLSVDGFGDFASAMWGVGRGSRIQPMGAVSFPHSLGILYTAVTQYLGFPDYGDEYKVMGLASYGEPEFLDECRRMVSAPENGGIGFRLGLDYFLHHRRPVEMTWEAGVPVVGRLFSDHMCRRLGPPRRPGGALEQRHRNIAASVQRRLEDVLLSLLRSLRVRTGLDKLCLAGGVAYNCVANGKILSNTDFKRVYVPPAAGDAGLAVGAALYVWHQRMGKPREFAMEHSYWGPGYSESSIRKAVEDRGGEIERAGARARRMDAGVICGWTAGHLAAGRIVGWFQGRMEWGPRALGNRSILADPRRADIRDLLNRKIKRREMFRPFAPAVLEEATGDYFEHSHPSPFMQMAYTVRPAMRTRIPAVTHVDGTGRLQTVREEQNPLFYELIRAFERETGVAVLLNTSFNENEPVVCTPDEAIDCFLRTNMDILVLGQWVIERAAGDGADTPARAPGAGARRDP